MSKEKPFPTKSIEEVQKDLGITEEELDIAGLEILYEEIAKYLKLKWHEVVQIEPCLCGDKCPSETVICTCSCGETFTNTGSDQDHITDNNPDFSTPDGMVMILDRLVEMGYEWSIDSKGRKGSETYVYIVKPDPTEPYIYDEFCVSANAATALLAVISAVESLIRKEEEGE